MSEIELNDAILRNTLQLLRLSAGEQAEVDAILRELERELKLSLESKNISAATKAQLKALIADAEKLIDPAYRAAGASLDTHALALIVAEKTAEIIEDVSAAAIKRVTAETLASLTKDVLIDGSPSSAWWAKQSEDTAFKFAAQVRQGVINGETNERIVQRIVGRRGEPGIMDVARRNARTLVHSSVLNSAAVARLETFKANQQLFKGVRWLASLDMKTCTRCAALDGQQWDFEGKKLPGTTIDYQMPLAHFGCRCTITGATKTLRERGIDSDAVGAERRASQFGQITGDTSFDAFLKRMTPEQIAETLGARRAEMYRAGKITIRDLVSGTGRELTLDEIR